MIADALGAVTLLVWIYLLAGRGGFWRVARALPLSVPPSPASRRIVAIIPARDEAAVIGDTISSLLEQQYAGPIHLIVVDDGSADNTAATAADAAARSGRSDQLTIVAGSAPPSGWSGKVWAMSQGVAAARPHQPDYLLFTDADIHHAPTNVATLVAQAEHERLDLMSYMVQLSTASRADRLLIPAFVFFFFMLYPPAWVASRGRRTAAAAGGCMLVRPQALERAGGFAAIRGEIIDDCALARAIKSADAAIALTLTRSAHSTRAYGSFGELGRMVSRSAFNQLRHSYLLLAATVIGLALTYVLPVLLLLSGHWLAFSLAAAACALMVIAYAPMLRFYGLSRLRSITLPAVALFYAGASIQSALQYATGRGGRWKGRVQDQRG